VPDGSSTGSGDDRPGAVSSTSGIVFSFALLKPLLLGAVRLSCPDPIGGDGLRFRLPVRQQRSVDATR
jgi:hypothetical protein